MRLWEVDPEKHTMKKIPICTCGRALKISMVPHIHGVCHDCKKKYEVKDFVFE